MDHDLGNHQNLLPSWNESPTMNRTYLNDPGLQPFQSTKQRGTTALWKVHLSTPQISNTGCSCCWKQWAYRGLRAPEHSRAAPPCGACQMWSGQNLQEYLPRWRPSRWQLQFAECSAKSSIHANAWTLPNPSMTSSFHTTLGTTSNKPFNAHGNISFKADNLSKNVSIALGARHRLHASPSNYGMTWAWRSRCSQCLPQTMECSVNLGDSYGKKEVLKIVECKIGPGNPLLPQRTRDAWYTLPLRAEAGTHWLCVLLQTNDHYDAARGPPYEINVFVLGSQVEFITCPPQDHGIPALPHIRSQYAHARVGVRKYIDT